MSFWAGKKVLVTGHTGFKGSWLALKLHHLGAEVHGISLPPATQPSLYEACVVGKFLKSESLVDIRNQNVLSSAMNQVDPEIIIHMAAQALVLESYESPVETINSNVMGTIHLLESCRKLSRLRVVINVTTDKVYDNLNWVWPYRENDRLGGKDVYSASKAAVEILSKSYWESFLKKQNSLSLIHVRAGNVIGGGDWSANRLIPDCLNGIRDGGVINLRNPSSIRPWQHVLDCLHGYLLAAEYGWNNLKTFETFNFSPSEDKPMTVLQIAESIVESMKIGKVSVQNAVHHEEKILRLDSSKARMTFGWQPKLQQEPMLKWTIDWYRDYHEKPQEAVDITRQQIAAYLSL